MPRDSDCIFCKIVAGEVPASIVYRTDTLMAFLDVGPLADGHLLVIPRDHYQSLVDMPPEACAALALELPKLGCALLEVTGAEGFNLLQNNGGVAGQVVHHVHFHLIPRKAGDGLGYRWNAGKYAEGRAAELAAAFEAAISQGEDRADHPRA